MSQSDQIWSKIREGIFVIAEGGKNFIQTEEEKTVKEYLENAKKLARAAKQSGADAIKFQTHNVEDEQLNINVVSPHFKGSDRYSWVTRNDKLTPVEEFWKPLKSYCDEIGLFFFSTPMSRGAAYKLMEVGVDLWKVGSGDILDFVLLDYIASTNKPIIIASGMSDLNEVDKAVKFLKERNAQVALMHCVSKYPCPAEELNLATIKFFKQRYNMPIGFSDHSVDASGIQPALVAAQLGATLIEKHFSFSREFWGSDHKASILPEEMKKLTQGIAEIKSGKEVIDKDEARKYLGSEGKSLQDGEAVFRPYFRKSLVAGCEIKPGMIIDKKMIYAMRPQKFIKGLPSEKFEEVIGKKANVNIKKYTPITEELIKI